MAKLTNFEKYRKVGRQGLFISKPLAEQFVAVVKVQGLKVREVTEAMVKDYLEKNAK